MTRKTPPAAWDRRALEVARGIATLDRSKISPAQFTAIVQTAIVDGMMLVADESALTATPSITLRPAEIQINAAGVALTEVECEMLRAIADRMRRAVDKAREAGGLAA
jgi:hypothetical protein